MASSLPTLLAIAGFACHMTGFLLYFWQIRCGNTKPNLASWTVWLVVTILNLASYGVMTGDFTKTVPIIAGALGCLSVTAYAYVKGTRQALGPVEQGTLAFGGFAILVWIIGREATAANLIIQGGDIVAFVPTVIALVRTRQGEHPAPWAAWSLGFLCSFGVTVASWQGHWAELAYPVVSSSIHLVMLGFAFVYWNQRSTKQKYAPPSK